ncbi:hypothetical protein TWF718_002514 [Orbilia javanica]|uniref:Beta-glucuronidase C-terminal domain-containing protein n=1 Tax=Orbilia javanica TaxID=47235 RepID=A0AAN8NMD1_9PEZI
MGLQHLLPSTILSLLCVNILFITESQAQLGNSAVINISPTLSNAAAASTMDSSFLGYSLEHNAVPNFAKSQIMVNLMNIWKSKTGVLPSVRIGGAAMDKTTYVPNFRTQPVMWVATPASEYWVGPSYFTLVKNYFPSDTRITFGLNLVNSTGNWSNSVQFAVEAKKNIPQVDLFEIGNEPDLYVGSNQRKKGWTGKEYAEEWKFVANRVKEVLPNAQFQPAVFASSLKDGFDLSSLIAAGINRNQYNIPSYSLHFYPQSACSSIPNLNNLVDHSLLGQLLQKFNPEIAAAESSGSRFTLAESNSVSCSGFNGVSDTFASALWLVDYALTAATKNIERIYFHNGPTTPYSLFIPRAASGLKAGIRPISFGVYFLAEALALPAQGSTTKFLVSPLSVPDDQSDIVVYGLYSNKVQKPDLDVIGTTTFVYTTAIPTTRAIVHTDKSQTLISVSTKMIIRSVSTSTRSSTSTRIVTVTKSTNTTKRTTVRMTSTTTRSSVSSGKTTIWRVTLVSTKTTTVTVPTTTQSRSTSRTVITSLSRSTFWTSQRTTITKTVERATPLLSTSYTTYTTNRAVTSTNTKATIKPQPTDIGDFPMNDGIFLARAVILNLSPHNTSDARVLSCRSCAGPSPAGYGSTGERSSTSVTLKGFQPNHRLKLIRLRGPGLNAKSGITVSGIIFNEDTGTLKNTAVPESVNVDKTGAVGFRISASEAVLLVDEKVV